MTLTGVGGVGKTRLALEVAAEVVPQYRDGAWLVELAGVRDPEAVPDAVVSMFGLQISGGSSATTTLVEFLRGKELLLVVDNCEHLLRAVADLVDEVVRGCPGVRVLATSREGLNVAGERMLGVASLDVPPDAAGLEAIAQCDAVVLFVERARAVKASFALDATNADAVAQVCRRLDGIALAIELAAARVAMLTPAEVARRLDQRFRLLAGGQRTAVERHQTLRAAIDWSYELLSETEQLLLDRLSIFVGGFSLEAAEAVAAGGAIETDDVFELLATLVARSLVVADTEGVETRYRLLETIRQYAQERLDDSGDGDRLRARTRCVLRRLRRGGHHQRGRARRDRVGTPLGARVRQRPRRAHLGHRHPRPRHGACVWWPCGTRPSSSGTSPSSPRSSGPPTVVLAIPGASEHPKYPAALAVTASIAWMQSDQELARRRCDEAARRRAAPRHRAEHPHLVCPSQLRAGAGQPRRSRRARAARSRGRARPRRRRVAGAGAGVVGARALPGGLPGRGARRRRRGPGADPPSRQPPHPLECARHGGVRARRVRTRAGPRHRPRSGRTHPAGRAQQHVRVCR